MVHSELTEKTTIDQPFQLTRQCKNTWSRPIGLLQLVLQLRQAISNLTISIALDRPKYQRLQSQRLHYDT